MAALGAVICQAIVHHYGRDEFLRRLLHPFGHRTAAIAERLLPLARVSASAITAVSAVQRVICG